MQAEKSRLSKQETIGTCGKKSLQIPDFFVCKFRGKNGFNGNIFMYLIMSKTELRSFISLWRTWATSESSEFI